MKRFLVAGLLMLAGAAAMAAEPADARTSVSYWTTAYAGEDLTAGKFNCQPPAIPAYSKTNADIKATGAAIDAWQACYNGFADNLNDAMPPGKRIPAEVRAKMTPAELEQATRHLDQVYGKVVAQAQEAAAATMSKREAWQTATNKYIAEQNQLAAIREEAEKRSVEMDLRRRQETQGQVEHGMAPVAPAGK